MLVDAPKKDELVQSIFFFSAQKAPFSFSSKSILDKASHTAVSVPCFIQIFVKN